MKYKSKNNYYKYYNKDGKCARIKFKNKIENTSILVKFKNINDELWKCHHPSKIFENEFDVIKFLMKNLENDCVIFEVTNGRLKY